MHRLSELQKESRLLILEIIKLRPKLVKNIIPQIRELSVESCLLYKSSNEYVIFECCMIPQDR